MRNALAALTLLGFAAPLAYAQAPTPGRADVFTVAGARVDVTAPDATQARNKAIADAQNVAFDRLVRRLVSAEDLARIPPPKPVGPALDRLVRGFDVEDERRSGTRYIARFAVTFDGAQVRTLLREAGYTVLETRAPPLLVAPVTGGTAPPTAAFVDAWRRAWTEGGFANELQPLSIAPPVVTGAPDWSQAAASATAAASSTAIYAIVRQPSATSLAADLIEVGPQGMRRERGQVSASISGGEAGLADAMRRLANAANDRLQGEWRTRLAAGGGQRQRLVASALYESMADWGKVKVGLEAAARTLISEIRIEAIAKDGALVSFSYVGDQAQLATEMHRLGLKLEQTAQGPVLRVAR
jgi:hypothetical protein